MSCAALMFLISIQSQLLLLLLSFFLIPYIFANHVLIQTNGVHAIALGPKMIAPIGLSAQFPKLIEHFHRCLTFDAPHKIGNRHLRRDHHQMYMVLLTEVLQTDRKSGSKNLITY